MRVITSYRLDLPREHATVVFGVVTVNAAGPVDKVVEAMPLIVQVGVCVLAL